MTSRTQTTTVLFTDMVSSTGVMAGMQAPAAEELRSRHFAALRSALAVHRGHEVKTLGDGMMAVFDSASEAIGCAVTVQRAIATHNRHHPHLALQLRVGVSAGETTCEDNDYFGMPVVEASRLCAAAEPGQILVADVVRALSGGRGAHRLERAAEMTLRGIPHPVTVWVTAWDPEEEFTLRVALADDSVLLREGIAHMLQAEGIQVVLQAGDAETLLDAIAAARPHVAVLDVRMPPTHTTEGLDAARQIRAEHPDIGVLVLSASVNAAAARRLLEFGGEGVGYMLKERVGDVAQLTAAIRAIASGGSAIDPEVIAAMDGHVSA